MVASLRSCARIMHISDLKRIAEIAEVCSWQELRPHSRSRDGTLDMASPSLPIVFSDSELKLLQNLIYQECGMYFDERRTHFLRDRLQRRMQRLQRRIVLRVLPPDHRSKRKG